MKSSVLIVFLAASSCFAQQTLSIKGHSAGETLQTFLRAEEGTQRRIDSCRERPKPREISEGEVRQMKIPSFEKNQYLQLARQHQLFDRTLDEQDRECASLLSEIGSDGRFDIAVEYSKAPEQSITFTFERGTLIAMSMLTVANPDDLARDISERIGVSPHVTTLPYQNGFGARWMENFYEWNGADVYVSFLDDSQKPGSGFAGFLTVLSRNEKKRRDDEQAQKKSPLDR